MKDGTDILRQMVVVLLAGVGIVSLIAVPCEGIALSRWFALFLVSKAVGVFAMALAIYLYGVGSGVVPPLNVFRRSIRRLRSLWSLNHRLHLWSGYHHSACGLKKRVPKVLKKGRL